MEAFAQGHRVAGSSVARWIREDERSNPGLKASLDSKLEKGMIRISSYC